jgi:hypothetical protein
MRTLFLPVLFFLGLVSLPVATVGCGDDDTPDTTDAGETTITLTAEPGQACDEDGGCKTGRCLTGESFPDGLCSKACAADADCGSGFSCREVCREGESCEFACLPTCGAALDCRNGYACAGDGVCFGDALCRPECAREGALACDSKGRTVRCERVDSCLQLGSAATCAAGEICANGACVAPPEGKGADCTQCAADGDCKAGYACKTGPRGSYCLKACAADGDCTALNYLCNPFGADASASYCQPAGVACSGVVKKPSGQPCLTGAECEKGLCLGAEGAKICAERCGSAGECTEGQVCAPLVLAEAEAQPAVTPPVLWDSQCISPLRGRLGAGAQCTTDNQCSSALCLPAAPAEGQVRTCAERCQTAADCPTGQDCLPTGANALDGRAMAFCAPPTPCVPSNGVIEACDQKDNNCDGRIDENNACDGMDVQYVDLGTLSLAKSSGACDQTLNIDVPQNPLSVTIQLSPVPYSGVGLCEIRAPDGSDLLAKTKVGARGGVFTFTFPNTPRTPITPGRYTVALGSGVKADNVKAEAYIKTGPATVAKGTIGLNVHLVGVQGVSAATAPKDESITLLLDTTKRLLERVGITLSDTTFYELKGRDARDFQIIETFGFPLSEYDNLIKKTAVVAEPTRVNLFLIRQFGGNQGVIGVSAGLPGAFDAPGSTTSGVVAQVEFGFGDWRDRSSLAFTAGVIAHELGHYLGLFHTSEATGTEFDPIDDTPECPVGNDRNGDGEVGYNECGGKGIDNLMFWQAGSLNATFNLTADQGYVLLRNPHVR